MNKLITDSLTMFRRSLRRMRRYPSLTIFIAAIPVVLLLLFTFVLGGTLGAGLGGQAPGTGSPAPAGGTREAYLAYIVPGILLATVAGSGQGTAISVAMDMTAGIIARFRTMSIARGSVLAGHVLGSVLQALLATALVALVAVAIGFRPTTGPVEWLAAAGLVALTGFAIGWLCVGLGMASNSVETASNTPMFLVLMLFMSSAFVPTASLPGPIAWFAEHQPFTPIIETMRGLLVGTPIGNDGLVAIAWCVVVSLGAYLWALRLYERVPARTATA
jgi:ABC-2 type transport system permease protein